MDDRVKKLREEAREDLSKLHGLPPYSRNNPCYADGYFANSIKDKYGMTISAVEEWTGIEKDPYGVVIKQLEHWLELHNDHKTGEKICVYKNTVEDMLSLMKHGTTKK